MEAISLGMLEPLGARMLAEARIEPGARVLEIAPTGGGPLYSESHVSVVSRDGGIHRVAGEYDVVLCRMGLNRFQDPFAGVKEMAACLRPGGTVVFSTWSSASANPWVEIALPVLQKEMGETRISPAFEDLFRFGTASAAGSLLDSAGLGSSRLNEVNGTLRFDDAETHWSTLTGSIEPITRLLASTEARSLERVRKLVIEEALKRRSEKGICLGWGAWVCSGKKPCSTA